MRPWALNEGNGIVEELCHEERDRDSCTALGGHHAFNDKSNKGCLVGISNKGHATEEAQN